MPRRPLVTEYVRVHLLPGTARAAVSEQHASLSAGRLPPPSDAATETLWLAQSLRRFVSPLPSPEAGTHNGDLLWLTEVGESIEGRTWQMAHLTRAVWRSGQVH